MSTFRFFFFFFFLLVQEQSITRPHQSIEMTLETAAGHIKLTCSPCLFLDTSVRKCKPINNSN